MCKYANVPNWCAGRKSRRGNDVSGDVILVKRMSKNRVLFAVGDGMGSGSRARIDSALACSLTSRLIKSGISLSAVLETVNTSLMVKSADESFAATPICLSLHRYP